MPAAVTSEETLWRINTYRLLAQLLTAPADKKLLARLAGIKPTPGGNPTAMEQAWCGLATTVRQFDPSELGDEYHALFIGLTGGELLPYGSYYQCGFLMEKPLLLLREDLQKLGFQRQSDVCEPEDHIAALCEIMSLLVQENNPKQSDFFNKHLAVWAPAFLQDLERAKSAVFYRAVARLGAEFFKIEETLLQMNDYV